MNKKRNSVRNTEEKKRFRESDGGIQRFKKDDYGDGNEMKRI